MFLKELLNLSYLKEEKPGADETVILPGGVKAGVDYHMVVPKPAFEELVVAHRANEPMSEPILMAIWKANGLGDPVWNAMLQNESVIDHYMELCDAHYADTLNRLESQNPAKAAIRRVVPTAKDLAGGEPNFNFVTPEYVPPQVEGDAEVEQDVPMTVGAESQTGADGLRVETVEEDQQVADGVLIPPNTAEVDSAVEPGNAPAFVTAVPDDTNGFVPPTDFGPAEEQAVIEGAGFSCPPPKIDFEQENGSVLGAGELPVAEEKSTSEYDSMAEAVLNGEACEDAPNFVPPSEEQNTNESGSEGTDPAGHSGLIPEQPEQNKTPDDADASSRDGDGEFVPPTLEIEEESAPEETTRFVPPQVENESPKEEAQDGGCGLDFSEGFMSVGTLLKAAQDSDKEPNDQTTFASEGTYNENENEAGVGESAESQQTSEEFLSVVLKAAREAFSQYGVEAVCAATGNTLYTLTRDLSVGVSSLQAIVSDCNGEIAATYDNADYILQLVEHELLAMCEEDCGESVREALAPLVRILFEE